MHKDISIKEAQRFFSGGGPVKAFATREEAEAAIPQVSSRMEVEVTLIVDGEPRVETFPTREAAERFATSWSDIDMKHCTTCGDLTEGEYRHGEDGNEVRACKPCFRLAEKKAPHQWALMEREHHTKPWTNIISGLTLNQMTTKLVEMAQTCSFFSHRGVVRYTSRCELDEKEIVLVNLKERPRRYIDIVLDTTDPIGKGASTKEIFIQVYVPDESKKGSKPEWRTVRWAGLRPVWAAGKTDETATNKDMVRMEVYNAPLSTEDAIETVLKIKTYNIEAQIIDGKNGTPIPAFLVTRAPKGVTA